MKGRFGYLNRKDYLLIILLGLAFTVSAALFLVHYFHTRARLEAGQRQEAALAARYAAGQISDFLEHEQATLVSVAGLVSLSGDVQKGRAQLDLVLKTHKPPRKFFSFFVLDKDGRFLYSAPESLVDRYMQDLSGQGYFKGVVKARGFYETGAQADGKGGWEMVLCAPVISDGGEGRLLGVLAEKIDLGVLDGMFVSKIDVGRDGYAFLVDENGRVLATKNGTRLHQAENSSEMPERMLGGAEGSGLKNPPGTGRSELTAFSPLIFGGRTWSVGIVRPMSLVRGEESRNLGITLVMMSLTALAFSWGVVSVARNRRFMAGMSERVRASDQLILRNRQLATLNDLSAAMSGSEDLDGLLKKALEIIMTETSAKGGAVALVSPPHGGLVLKACVGVHASLCENASCAEALQPYCSKALAEGRPEYLSRKALPAADPECRDELGKGLLLVPLLVEDKPLGMLLLWGVKEEDLSEERAEYLIAGGSQIAQGVQNAVRIEDTNRHSARANALFHTARALTRSLDLDALLNIIMEETVSLLKVRRGLLLLYNEETNRIDVRVALGFGNMPAGALSFSPSGVFWDALEDGGVKVVESGETVPDLPRRFTENLGLDSFILVPLVSRGKVLGFIILEMLDKADSMLEDLKFMAGFANQAAVAIETSSFYIRTVEKYNEDLRRLSKRIIEAQEEERRRISRDLHDELGQLLTAIKINLDMAIASLPPDFEQVRSRLKDAVNLVLSTLESVRRLSSELRPSMLDDLGLSTVLGKLISDFRKRTGTEIVFSEEGPSERLDPRIEVGLYRVVQEALTNIAKHAKATKVVVSLKKDPDKGVIGLSIEDDGSGFSLRPDGHRGDSKGLGLMGIKERVSLLGGNFRIFAGKDKGTRLLIDIPWAKGEGEKWKEM